MQRTCPSNRLCELSDPQWAPREVPQAHANSTLSSDAAKGTATTRQIPTVTDVEKQLPGQSDEPAESCIHERCAATLQCLFHLPEDQSHWYSSAGGCCQYLESCFSPLLTDEYSCVWRALGKRRPLCAADCWPFFHAACAAIRAKGGVEGSIENIWDGLLTDPIAHPPATRATATVTTAESERDACHVAVFSILCWATMAFRPRLLWEDFDGPSSLLVRTDSLDKGMQPIERAKRPAHAVFRQFRRAMTKSRWRHPIGDIADEGSRPAALEVSCLNYASLQNTAKIKLVWVSDITSHLDFDAMNRRLFLFRFPAFCVLGALAGVTAPDAKPPKPAQASPMLVR